MKKGWGINERHAADPVGSNEPRGKDRSERKHKLDGGWTGSELAMRNRLMRQFMKSPDGSAHRDESAYKQASCWCTGCDGRRLASSDGLCISCWGRKFDIPTLPILMFLMKQEGWSTHAAGHGMPTVQDAMPAPSPPEKLQRAKMKSLCERGWVVGCWCGCRGDWEITAKGRAHVEDALGVRVIPAYP